MTSNGSESIIRITLKVFGGLRDAFPEAVQSLELPAGATVDDLYRRLALDVPDATRMLQEGLAAGYLNVLVNGRNIQFLSGGRTVLHDADVVACLPPVGGG